jgi:hypothetical protein
VALFCLISAGGSPGVTTTALGLALTWTRPVVLAECDPAHRSLLPGFLAERLRRPAGPGLLGLAMEAHHGAAIPRHALDQYTITLDGDPHSNPHSHQHSDRRRSDRHSDRHGDSYGALDGERGRPAGVRLLPGIRDPRHAAQLGSVWPALAALFSTIDTDVIADLGCVGGSDTPTPLLTCADLVVMTVRPTLAQVDAAQPRLEALRETLGRRPALCLIGDGYPAREVRKALFDLPILGELPHAEADARVLSDGARPRRTFRTCLLVRTITALGRRMRHAVDDSALTTANTTANTAGNTAAGNTAAGDAMIGDTPFGGRR